MLEETVGCVVGRVDLTSLLDWVRVQMVMMVMMAVLTVTMWMMTSGQG